MIIKIESRILYKICITICIKTKYLSSYYLKSDIGRYEGQYVDRAQCLSIVLISFVVLMSWYFRCTLRILKHAGGWRAVWVRMGGGGRVWAVWAGRRVQAAARPPLRSAQSRRTRRSRRALLSPPPGTAETLAIFVQHYTILNDSPTHMSTRTGLSKN